MSSLSRFARCFFAFLSLSLLGGCAAIYLAITGSDLELETRLSETVFLDPVAPDKRIVYVSVKNSSAQRGFNIERQVKSSIAAKGYRITDNPQEAYYWLQCNVRFVGETSQNAAEAVFEEGFGSPIVTGILAGTLADALDASDETSLIIGTAVAIGAALVDWSVEDARFSVITDLQISEPAAKGETVSVRSRRVVRQGEGGGEIERGRRKSDRKRYRTRILSSAHRVNLTMEEALPPLKENLVSAISGIF